jgi:hypothetical protein
MSAKGAIVVVPPPAQVDDSTDTKDLRKQVIGNANELLELITIEMTVRSQMRSNKQEVKALANYCKQQSRKIEDLQQKIEQENKKVQEMGQVGDSQVAPEPLRKNPDVITQLEAQLQGLYEERATLLNSRRG